MLKVLSFLLFTFFSFLSFSQPVFFEKIFGTVGNDFARSVKQASDGNIYVGGYSSEGPYGGFDISVSKLDRYGNLKWIKYYGYAYSDYALYMNKCDGENLIICGETYTAAGESDIIVIKIDSAGNKLWERVFNIPLYESAKYIEQTSDSGYIISGFKSDTSGSNDIYVVKLDSLGNKQWEKTIGGANNDYSDMIRQTNDGGYILTSDTDSKGAGGVDIEITKLDSIGNVKWDLTYGDSFQNGCQGILITSDNNYLSYGETNVKFNYSPFDFYLEKLDTTGTSIWKKVFGGAGTDAVFSVVETGDKGFVCTGYSNSYNGEAPIDLIVFKTDSLGNLLWVNTYGGNGIDIGYDIIASADSGFLITGKVYTTDDGYFLLHLNKEGQITENKKYYTKQKMTVFPNPCVDGFYLTPPDHRDQLLNLYTPAGKLILSRKQSGIKEFIPVKTLAKGLYFLEIITSDGIYTSKIIVTE